MKDTRKWLADHFGAPSIREAASALGMDHKKLIRWTEDECAPWVVIALARKYGLDPVDRLFATGILEPDEAHIGEVTLTLRGATDQQLSQEIVRRVQGGGFHAMLNDPIEVGDESEVDIPMGPVTVVAEGVRQLSKTESEGSRPSQR